MRRLADIFEPSIAQILVERVASRMLLIERANVRSFVFVKPSLAGNSLPGSGPHVGNVDVLMAVIVEIRPRCAHAGADVVGASFFGDRGERSVALVTVEIATAKVVCH